MAPDENQTEPTSTNKCKLISCVIGCLVIIICAVVLIVYFVVLDQQKEPNIIFVLLDDNGYNDVPWKNYKKDVFMPTIERMAREGNILEYHYMQPACSPSRGAYMTGRYAHHIGMQHNVITNKEPECAPKAEKFISEELKGMGYATHLLGKWHLGFCNWDCTPLYRGFDTFYGYYGGMIHHYSKDYDGGYDWQDDKMVEWSTNGTYDTDLMRERAVKIISEHDKNKPLFLQFNHAAPHTPKLAPQKYSDLVVDNVVGSNIPTGDRLSHLAMLAAVDNSMEEIEKALIAKDMMANTIIIVTSDNGGEAFTGSSNYPLRGAKVSVYEGGTRVPAFVYSPGLMEKKGVVSEGLMHVTDWYPTLVAMAGGRVEKNIDGFNQIDMIMKNGKGARNEMIYNVDKLDGPTLGRGAIRVGDYKLILGFPGMYDGWEKDDNVGETYEVDLLSEGKWSYNSTHNKENAYDYDYPLMLNYSNFIKDVVQLYNIKIDPEERNNIATGNEKMVIEMTDALLAEMARSDYFDPKMQAKVEEAKPSPGEAWLPGWC